jgi:hypothetical protein
MRVSKSPAFAEIVSDLEQRVLLLGVVLRLESPHHHLILHNPHRASGIVHGMFLDRRRGGHLRMWELDYSLNQQRVIESRHPPTPVVPDNQ